MFGMILYSSIASRAEQPNPPDFKVEIQGAQFCVPRWADIYHSNKFAPINSTWRMKDASGENWPNGWVPMAWDSTGFRIHCNKHLEPRASEYLEVSW